MTDIQCPQCGHLALSVATRCPRCGHEFASDLLQPLPPMPRRPWLRPALGLAGLIVVVLGLAVVAGRREGSAPTPENAPAAPVATPSVDTIPPAPVAGPTPPAVSAAPPQPPPVRPAAVQPTPAAALRRYTTDWVNVRPRRSMSGAPVLVLKPGDSVLVDSLVRGWYRILTNGRAVGYAHRRFLAASPAGAGTR